MVQSRAELRDESSRNRLHALPRVPRPLVLSIQVRIDGLLGDQKENTGPVSGEGRKTACGRMLGNEQRAWC